MGYGIALRLPPYPRHRPRFWTFRANPHLGNMNNILFYQFIVTKNGKSIFGDLKIIIFPNPNKSTFLKGKNYIENSTFKNTCTCIFCVLNTTSTASLQSTMISGVTHSLLRLNVVLEDVC